MQIAITYRGENDKRVVYDTAYDPDEAQRAVRRCAEQHGWDRGVLAVDAAKHFAESLRRSD